MKNIKYILVVSILLLVGFSCTNFQHKKTDSVTYKTINGDKVRVTIYDDGSQTIENLSLSKGNKDNRKEVEEKNNPNRE